MILLLACADLAENADCREACGVLYEDCAEVVSWPDALNGCSAECEDAAANPDWSECVLAYEPDDRDECLAMASACLLSPCPNGPEGLWDGVAGPYTCE